MARIQPEKNWPDLPGDRKIGDMPQFEVFDVRLRPIHIDGDGNVKRFRLTWYDKNGGRHDFEVDADATGFWAQDLKDVFLDWLSGQLPGTGGPP